MTNQWRSGPTGITTVIVYISWLKMTGDFSLNPSPSLTDSTEPYTIVIGVGIILNLCSDPDWQECQDTGRMSPIQRQFCAILVVCDR